MANQAGAPAATRWRIVAQQEGTRPDPTTGRYVQGVLVTFQIVNSGQQGSVFIPEAAYNPDAVKAAVQARVDVMSAVQGLTG